MNQFIKILVLIILLGVFFVWQREHKLQSLADELRSQEEKLAAVQTQLTDSRRKLTEANERATRLQTLIGLEASVIKQSTDRLSKAAELQKAILTARQEQVGKVLPEVELASGAKLKNAQVLKVEDNELIVKHDDGVTRVQPRDLTGKLAQVLRLADPVMKIQTGFVQGGGGTSNASAATTRTAAPNKPASQQPDADGYVDMLPDAQKEAVVFIQGDRGEGTGFVVNLKGRAFILTNQHVLGKNKKFEIKSLKGTPFKVDAIFGAREHDIAMLRIASPAAVAAAFEVEEDVPSACKVGDEVLIPGNSLGGRTILQTKGKIVALGPQRIEHDAPTYPGNSGSPIVLVKSWKVLGVHTLSAKISAENWSIINSRNSSDSQIKSDVRRFGYRVDSVTKWDQIDWAAWIAQISEIESVSGDVVAVMAAFDGKRETWLKSKSVANIMTDWEKTVKNSSNDTASKRTKSDNTRLFLRSIAVRMRDLARQRTTSCYDYLRSEFEGWRDTADLVIGEIDKNELSLKSQR